MPLPKSFAADGAFGAGGTSAAGTPSGSPPAPSPPTGGITDYPTSPGRGRGRAPSSSFATPSRSPSSYNGYGGSSSGDGGPLSPSSYNGYGGFSGGGDGARSPSPVGLSFSQGGAIDDGDDDDTGGSPQQAAIQKALNTVDGVLAFGRKLHGLGEGNEEGAIQTADAGYQNGRMPARPGTQSNSGVLPIQPMPGPLPPTSNPFGKRADASQGQDQDQGQDQSGAIDMEEEAT